MKKTRIKDIADYLDINPSTVSRALNPKTRHMISKHLATKIQNAADKLDYSVNLAAVGLRKQRSQTIGMIVPDILNPVFPLIVNGVQQYLKDNNYALFIVYSNNDEDEAMFEMKRLISRRVDGLIVASAFIQDKSITYALKQNIPIVAVNRSFHDENLLHHVLVDDGLGIQQAIDHLIELGHQHIIHFAGPQNILQSRVRKKCFLDYCQQQNILHDHFELQSFGLDAGLSGASEFIRRQHPATAIVAGNDLIALGAIKAFVEHGVHVPDDISMVGFNGMYMADYVTPSLTTIEIPHHQLGEHSAKIILHDIESSSKLKQKIVLQPKLVVRDSTNSFKPTSVRSQSV